MSTDVIDVGTTANDGTGDTLRAGAQAVNTMLQKADAASGAKLNLHEATGGGTSKASVTVPALSGDRTFTLADADVDMAEVLAENTDGQLWVPALSGYATAGTWAYESGSNSNAAMTLTPASGVSTFVLPVNLPARSSASKGRKVTSYKVIYDIDTANADDVTCPLNKITIPADGSGMAAKSPFAVTYDANHDTAGKRGDATGAPEYHTMTCTLSSPAYVGDGEGLELVFTVDGDAVPSTDVRLYGVQVCFSETLVDAS